MNTDKEYKGLTEKEANEILQKEGLNQLPEQKGKSIFTVFWHVISEPMFMLLIAGVLIYSFIGEASDALMLSTFVLLIIGITFYQERKTEKTLQALKDLSSPMVLVLRDGEKKRISGYELVKGDTIIIREGDRVPADAIMLKCENLFVDESLLTGESLPVRKSESKEESNTVLGGDDTPFIYSGTMAVSGWGIARVTHTGINTEIGKIGKSLQDIKEEDTLLHKETSQVVKVTASIGLILCELVVLYYYFVKGNLIAGILAGITLSMSMVPEEFPVVLMIFLTLGAWRISRKKVLARKSSVIETLGAATVLCTDKTGTLTMNKMALSMLFSDGKLYEISKQKDLSVGCRELLRCAALASKKEPFDPIEKEIMKATSRYSINSIYGGLNLLHEYPLSKMLLSLSQVWESDKSDDLIVAAKGAPEAILDICHVDEEERQAVMERVRVMSGEGLRVLGVARSSFKGRDLPSDQHNFKFDFIGLLGFIDPVRPDAKKSVEEAYGAGIRVMMITGDYLGTAQFVAKQVGIINPENYLTGGDLKKINHLELRERIKTVNVFARVMPEQKLLIVNALKANNEVVAMIGDGVNDAPALKAAHIGISMGERGTDVAREASALVLLNDDFSSILSAVRLGRRIYDNLKRAMCYIIAVHLPIAGMVVLPLFFGLPSMLFPAHIAFLELIIDPACSIVFEAEKEGRGIMKRKPRPIRQSMFSRKMILIGLLQGMGAMIISFALFFLAIKSGRGEVEARSFVFACLVVINLLLIMVNLSWEKNIIQVLFSGNRTLLMILALALVSLSMVFYVSPLANLFHLTPLRSGDVLMIVGVSVVSILWFELLKSAIREE
ncbi:MAG: cation-translocating P-type ATPase [Candidatus Pacebacteria bacterium]|nr:cation-translocating P-type ATPase [Candidatus Paceibacterota bacterium]